MSCARSWLHIQRPIPRALSPGALGVARLGRTASGRRWPVNQDHRRCTPARVHINPPGVRIRGGLHAGAGRAFEACQRSGGALPAASAWAFWRVAPCALAVVFAAWSHYAVPLRRLAAANRRRHSIFKTRAAYNISYVHRWTTHPQLSEWMRLCCRSERPKLHTWRFRVQISEDLTCIPEWRRLIRPTVAQPAGAGLLPGEAVRCGCRVWPCCSSNRPRKPKSVPVGDR